MTRVNQKGSSSASINEQKRMGCVEIALRPLDYEDQCVEIMKDEKSSACILTSSFVG